MVWNSSRSTKIRVAYGNLAPFVDVRTFDGKDILKGFMPEIVKTVAAWMNLELIPIRNTMDKYGVRVNDTWDGMIGMLHRKEVDLIMNPILPEEEFLQFLHYTNPITIEAYTILAGKSSEEAGLFLYFRVLDKQVWLCIVIALLLVSGTSALLLRSSPSMKRNFNWINKIGMCCWVLLSFTLKQIPSTKWLDRKHKKGTSFFLHLLLVLWVVGVSFLVMNTFQSLLVSKLTMKETSPIVDSLADLARSQSVICLAPREIQIEHVLKDSPVAINRQAWQRIDYTKAQVEVFHHDTLGQIEKGKYCAIHGHLIMKDRLNSYYKTKGTCNMHLSENHFYPFSLLMAVHRDLPMAFFDAFNLGITRLVDADITGRWFESNLEGSNLCTSYSDNSLKPLGFQNIYGVVLLWIAGMTLAGIVLAIEMIIFRFRKKDVALDVKKVASSRTSRWR